MSLLAALLLVLQALFLASPAAANPASECPDADYVKVDTESATNTDLTVPDYDFNNATVGDTILITDTDGTVITIEIMAVKDGDEAITVKVTLDGDADFAITEISLKTGASDDADGDTPILLPGESVTVTTGGGAGGAISHITLCFGDVPPPPPVVGQPSGDLTTACGSWSADVAVSEGDSEATGTSTFEVREGTNVIDSVTLGAGESDTLDGTFGEDTGDHDIVLVLVDGEDGTTLDEGTVETDCEPPVVEVCPAGTDNAGTPVDEVDSCDEPDETEVCPAGTDNAGTPVDEVDSCDEPDETEVEPDVVAPAASVGATCDGVTANLDNTESDTAVTFTVVINGNEQTITVPAGASDSVAAALGNGDSWSAVVAAGDTVLAEGGDTEDCTVEVLPNVVEKPQPAPAVAPAAQELPATGLGSTELLLLSLLLIGLGGTMLLAPRARRQA